MSSNDLTTLKNLVDEEVLNIARFLICRCVDSMNTSLVEAVRSGQIEMVKMLLEHSANPNEAENGFTPLTQALHLKDRKCAELLIKHGADVNLEDDKGRLPLAVAVEYEDIDLVKLLLDEGAIIDNVFLEAIRRENLDIIELLIVRGANVNMASSSGKTPLMRALETGDPRIIQLLIEAGADVNLPDASGDTPLTHAIKQGKMGDFGETSRMEDLSFLIYYFDLEMDYFDAFESSWLSSSREGMNFELVRLLLDNGADVNLLNGLQQSPFSLAVAKKNLGLVKYLQQRGAVVDCVAQIREIAKENETWMAHFERLLNQK